MSTITKDLVTDATEQLFKAVRRNDLKGIQASIEAGGQRQCERREWRYPPAQGRMAGQFKKCPASGGEECRS
jgi:hypothetical protein